ncbi:maltose acetyltransferase domain-containing protein [Chryseobacterium sp. M5]|uniref:maltose acetyltransferase domain-containing protein n=1 Tax=Chryseobacterium sp. M5 TaxID=3379128 RepID=UPI003857AF75
MTEKEKCQNGLLYDANYDSELLNDRVVCKDFCLEYNQLKNSELEKRKELIKN